MDVATACREISARARIPPGHFYGSPRGLSVGAGLIYGGARYPLYNETVSAFDTYSGIAYILTHECDVDPNNVRPFNDHVLLCPLIRFDQFVIQSDGIYRDEELSSFFTHLTAHQINRVVYFPPLGNELPFGGLLYLNQICNCHIGDIHAYARPIACVTQKALREIDLALENHLRRPKVQNLPTG